MPSKDKKVNYVEESELREDVEKLYATGEFPERLATNLQSLVEHICSSRRFFGYTADWKEEMKSAATIALVTTLNARKFDLDREGGKVFTWATKVVFNQFYYWLRRKKREAVKDREIEQHLIDTGKTYYEGNQE
jgi:DNA-directed RNA polymerase specialized sigma24 family protein